MFYKNAIFQPVHVTESGIMSLSCSRAAQWGLVWAAFTHTVHATFEETQAEVILDVKKMSPVTQGSAVSTATSSFDLDHFKWVLLIFSSVKRSAVAANVEETHIYSYVLFT